jgi:hypothetical protein
MTFVSTLNYPPQTFSDSASFRSGDGLSNFNWVSFSGATHSRGWPIILIYSIFDTDKGRILFQTIFYFLSVSFVSNSLFRLRQKQERYSYYAVGFLLIGTLHPLLIWNNYISRESFSLSLVILSAGHAILAKSVFSRDGSSLLFIANCTIATLAIIVKPIMAPFLLCLLILHLNIYFLNYRLKGFSKQRLVSTILISVAVIAYGFWNSSNQNIGWSKADPTGRTLQEISYSYVISDFNYNSAGFLSYLRNSKTSTCFVPGKPLDTSLSLGLPMDTAAKFRQECSTFSDWVKNEYVSSYIKYQFAEPVNSAVSILRAFPGAFAILGDGRTHSIFSDWLGNLFLFNVFSISKFSFILLFWLNILLSYLNMRTLRITNEGRKILSTFSPILLFYTLLLSVVTSLFLQPTHVGDLSRQNYSANIMMRLIVLWQLFDLIFNLRAMKDRRRKGVSKSDTK